MNKIILPDRHVTAPAFPYTIVDVALVYRRVDDPTVVFLAMQCIMQGGVHLAHTDGVIEDFVERARILQAESWPPQQGVASDWEYITASALFHIMRGKS